MTVTKNSLLSSCLVLRSSTHIPSIRHDNVENSEIMARMFIYSESPSVVTRKLAKLSLPNTWVIYSKTEYKMYES
jgi:hypothetical protein